MAFIDWLIDWGCLEITIQCFRLNKVDAVQKLLFDASGWIVNAVQKLLFDASGWIVNAVQKLLFYASGWI